MHRIFVPVLLSLCLIRPELRLAADELTVASRTDQLGVAATDWPWWRGPRHDGIADPDQQPPLHWSAEKNVVWQSPIPGRGYGSVTVVDDQVLVATAEEARQTQGVICFDRQTGKRIWYAVVHSGGLTDEGNKKSSLASSTVASDGERLFINFLNAGAVYTTALDRDGQILWQTKITDYTVHQGYGSSPAPYGPLVIVSADNKGGGAIAGLDRATGKVVWRKKRPKKPNYASPIILTAHGRDQLVMTGCNLVCGLDPLTGEQLWQIEASTTECVTSTTSDGNRVFTSGGFPKNHMSAVQADGSGKIVWENTTRVYVPSMLVRDKYLYAIGDAGIAMCFRSDTGDQLWKGRLGGTFSASPVMVGEHIFVTNETGTTFIFKTDPNQFELVAENQLGDHVMATPTFCDSRIYMRVADESDGQRQEILYCLGREE